MSSHFGVFRLNKSKKTSYPCHVPGCGKTYKSVSSLNEHLRSFHELAIGNTRFKKRRGTAEPSALQNDPQEAASTESGESPDKDKEPTLCLTSIQL
ncbi:hypothetical protein CLU79DRAFT_568894 [Phycomyces nitens]|nr:hypothetical protein CLU79DRAFT_568894 [Phycomyces nitens]